MRWRTHLEKPADAVVFTAIIAVRDEDAVEPYLLNGIFHWKDGEFRDENDYHCTPNAAEYWWLPEEELTLPLQVARKA